MSKNLRSTIEFEHELLDSISDMHSTNPTFNACLNAHGMYETMRFVLRLSPRNHQLMDMIESDEFDHSNISSEALQAYSTYIHETIHWWQHVGSTSGLLLSLSYLGQCHSSLKVLREVLSSIGPKKPLKAYTDKIMAEEGPSANVKLASANTAVNNALDVEYYKAFAFSPSENIEEMMKENHFESIGHGYLIVYGQLNGMLSGIIDKDNSILPNQKRWDSELTRLNTEKIEGFYWRSPVRVPPVGLHAIYEGQARFIQLQFLDGVSARPLSCADWRDQGYLSGIYVKAFESFLKLTDSDWPSQLDSSLVALFLLICDLAINPTRGIPLEVDKFEDFITDTDVGIRFARLCQAIERLPHLKNAVSDYSKEEYINISEELTQHTGYDHPMVGMQAVCEWMNDSPELQALMNEYETFEYSKTNLPIRVFLSHFVALYQDKLNSPEFFCWTGIYMSNQREMNDAKDIWLRHLSLFTDRGDKDGVYPRNWPNRSEKNIRETFENFYGAMAIYDLTRQWILKDGPFECNFRWLAENYDQSEADEWGNNSFNQVFGVMLDEFEIIK